MGAAVQAALKADQKDVQDLVVTDIADAEPDGGGGGPELVPLRPFIYTSEEGPQAIGDDRDWTLLAAEADLEVSRGIAETLSEHLSAARFAEAARTLLEPEASSTTRAEPSVTRPPKRL